MPETEYEYELTVEEMLRDMEFYRDSLADIAMLIHQLNKRWWYDKNGNKLNRNKGELLALIHSEVSECLEGERKDLMDDHLPHRKMAEVELADVFLRLLDYAEGFGYDIAGAIVEKLFYNNSREDHTYEERDKMVEKRLTKKSEKEGAADLLAAFMWLDAVQLDEGNVSLTHTQIANGYATATNGSITCGHPVQFAYECAPLTKPILAALRKAKSNLSIVRDGQNLSVNSGRLCVSVPCLEAYDIFVVPPDRQKIALTNPQDFMSGLELCAPIATTASKLLPQLAGVLFDDETIAACDSKVAIQYAHSETCSLPNSIIPIQAVKLGSAWDDPLSKNPETLVCLDALYEFLATGKPIRQTIYECQDVRRFVSVRTVQGGSEKDNVYLGKAIRWYYAKGSIDSIKNKKNGHKVPKTEQAKPLMTLPDKLPDDIDYVWAFSKPETDEDYSRNSASSRAIPVKRMIEAVRKDPFIPLVWGKNVAGMQAKEELTGVHLHRAQFEWQQALEDALRHAENMCDLDWEDTSNPAAIGVHKQIVNRILEPYAHITVLVTSTTWDNFFKQRIHPDAEPHIRMLAEAMKVALDESQAKEIIVPYQDRLTSWMYPPLLVLKNIHTPYVDDAEKEEIVYDLQELDCFSSEEIVNKVLNLSVARCASTSYNTVEGTQMTLEKSEEIVKKLLRSDVLHASPFEHIAFPDPNGDNKNLWGNFQGFIQYRKLIEQEMASGK
ncbi:unnamed protein product [Sphagnum tenellum]